MNDQDLKKKKGDETENAFRQMLDRDNIPYLPFCDNMNKFSKSLRDVFKSKRPDVLILVRYIGFLIVDIKHKVINDEHKNFLFDVNEVEKYAHFREVFVHEIWFAISNEEIEYKKWYCVPSTQVERSKQVHTKNGMCHAIAPEHCIQIGSFNDLLKSLVIHQ